MAFESLHISVTSEPTIKLSFWIYWADWILALILSLGFVFYFHRLLGFIVSFVFKIFLWRHYKISVNIQSFKSVTTWWSTIYEKPNDPDFRYDNIDSKSNFYMEVLDFQIKQTFKFLF